jgi:hypothetical protein
MQCNESKASPTEGAELEFCTGWLISSFENDFGHSQTVKLNSNTVFSGYKLLLLVKAAHNMKHTM